MRRTYTDSTVSLQCVFAGCSLLGHGILRPPRVATCRSVRPATDALTFSTAVQLYVSRILTGNIVENLDRSIVILVGSLDRQVWLRDFPFLPADIFKRIRGANLVFRME